MRAIEFLTESRNRMYQYIKNIVPAWPDYVVRDWLYKGRGKANDFNADSKAIKDDIIDMIDGAGLSADTKWQLIPDMKFTMDMFEPKTKQRLIGRAGGSSDLGMGIPKDKERHATQAALAQQQGGVRKEPVLLIKSANGYELLEGWHRTIQHFHKFPNGYTGPAYVAVAQGQQGVAEGFTKNLDTDYFMNEGCGIFAVAMALTKPGSQIYIISNKSGESWSKSFPYEITHVFVSVPNKGQYDVRGQRSIEAMTHDFGLSKGDYGIKGPFDPKEFFTKFMGSSDNKPLYGTAKDVKELQQQIQNKQGVAEDATNNTPTIGINVRSDGNIDYASLIVDGKKKYESRRTDSLRPYVGKTVGIVRTGNGPAVAIGQVTIGEPIKVDAEKFNKLRNQHLVPQGSKFDIESDSTKYLYPMINPVRWDNEKPIKSKGIVSRKIDEAKLSVDVPNEDWLQEKIDYAKSKGRNSYGVPYMGSTTAGVVGTPPRVRVMRLASLPGMRNEQMNVRKSDLKWLMDYMEKTGKLPPMGNSPDREYLPYIMVAYNGEAWVNEGNHRIMAAYRLNWQDMPIEIRYFDGGERIKDGPMYPGKIGLGEVDVPRSESIEEVFEPGKQNWKWRRQSSDEAFASFVVGDREYVWEEEKLDEPNRIKIGGGNQPAKEWIDKVYTKYPHTMQNNHVMVWGEGDEQQFAVFELTPSFSKRGAVEVKWFQAYPLRQGVGSRAMKELQTLAKEDGITLTLFPWDKGQVSQSKLTKFYKGQGFKPTQKGSKSMFWDPSVNEEMIDEMPLPADWDPAQMRQQGTSFKSRLAYALERAKKLGVGSSRVATTIEYQGRPTVLKIAKNAKGLAQNSVEADILSDGYASQMGILIPIIDYDTQNREPSWVHTEIAQKANEKQLCSLMKCQSLNDLIRAAQAQLNEYGTRSRGILNDIIDKNSHFGASEQDADTFLEYVNRLAELKSSFDVELADFHRPANWGLYQGKPVIIDVGFNSNVLKQYY